MQVVGRTHHLLLSAWGARWREVQLAMFTAHIDDSGSDPNALVANATALIIPAKKIVALENEWNTLREKWGFSCFHMAEFAARNGDKEPQFANWNDVDHDKVFDRVRQICKKYGVQSMSLTVYKKDYDEVMPQCMRKWAGVHHYTWAIRSLLTTLLEWRLAHSTHPLEFVFDWMGEKRRNPRRQEIEDVMDQAEWVAADKGMEGEFSNWSFRRRQDIPGLQCVDVLAWSVYQYGLLAFTRKPLHQDAKTAWDDFGKYRDGKWGFDITFTRENLKKWADAELANGKSMARFAEWEQARKAKQ
jgi:hypothetical protein